MVYIIKRRWLRLYSLREEQTGHSKYVSGNSVLTPSTLNLKSPYFWLEWFRTFSATSLGEGGACHTNWFKSSISLSPPTPRWEQEKGLSLNRTQSPPTLLAVATPTRPIRLSSPADLHRSVILLVKLSEIVYQALWPVCSRYRARSAIRHRQDSIARRGAFCNDTSRAKPLWLARNQKGREKALKSRIRRRKSSCRNAINHAAFTIRVREKVAGS